MKTSVCKLVIVTAIVFADHITHVFVMKNVLLYNAGKIGNNNQLGKTDPTIARTNCIFMLKLSLAETNCIYLYCNLDNGKNKLFIYCSLRYISYTMKVYE